MNKKIFLLGVGAQKCGTTWLHSQISKVQSVDMGFKKEYHVFDTIFSEHRKRSKENLIKIVENRNKKTENKSPQNTPIAKRLSFIDNPENYFDYFNSLYLKDENVELVGDITPSYSMLNRDAFQYIKDGLESRGFNVKVVFLMRDPLERIWSMQRMSRRNQAKKGVAVSVSEDEQLKTRYFSTQTQLKTDYPRTITELESVFPEKDIYYGFYETLFTESSYKSLSDFLTIPLDEPDFDFKANVSPKNLDLNSELKSEIVNAYKHVYDALNTKTNGDIKGVWGGYDYIK
ncbi:MAG: hypothetical protein ACI9VT_000430 [Psychroserpens sp.]|jgi:hypothetical protein